MKTQGRRLQDPAGPFAPGDYAKNTDGTWAIRPPRGHLGTLIDHTVEEHEDGTITVSPSILHDAWHGYLRRGVWEEC